MGPAQVRSARSVERQPALLLAAYAILLLAAERAFAGAASRGVRPPPQWQRARDRPRLSTSKLIQQLPSEVWADALERLDENSNEDAVGFLGCGVGYFAVLWLVAFIAGGLGLLISRLFYRLVEPDPLSCPGCGYNLVGLTERRCPECGREFSYEELGTNEERFVAASRAGGARSDKG